MRRFQYICSTGGKKGGETLHTALFQRTQPNPDPRAAAMQTSASLGTSIFALHQQQLNFCPAQPWGSLPCAQHLPGTHYRITDSLKS